MQKAPLRIFVLIAMFAFAGASDAQRQRTRSSAQPPPRPVIFAVLRDGTTLEPIAFVNRGKLEPAVNGSDERRKIEVFNKNYYKPGATYRLIFGSANSGSVAVKSSDAKADCSANIASAETTADKTPLRGLVMGLATNAPRKSTAASYRRRPSDAERNEIETLVRAEYTRQKLTPKVLRYHNLTALDLNNDGKAEMVGSYWVEIDQLTRGLLFFIAGQSSSGKYTLGYREYRSIDQSKVMSGEIKSVDEGVYHELLLDAFDYDGDGSSEVFTYVQGFEGASFNVYRQSRGRWVKSFEGSNYHCAF